MLCSTATQCQKLDQALAAYGVSLADLARSWPVIPSLSQGIKIEMDLMSKRQDYVKRYSYAVPTREAIAAARRFARGKATEKERDAAWDAARAAAGAAAWAAAWDAERQWQTARFQALLAEPLG